MPTIDRGTDAMSGHTDAQLAELLEVVYACERTERTNARIDSAVRYS